MVGFDLGGNFYYSQLLELNNILYFFADDGSTRIELWRSDGTSEGTEQVKDIFPGSGFSTYDHTITVSWNKLYFAA